MCRWRRVNFGQSVEVPFQQSFEHGDGGDEVVAEEHEQVDCVEILVAGEAVGEVVAGS